jgi:hypothetical protein
MTSAVCSSLGLASHRDDELRALVHDFGLYDVVSRDLDEIRSDRLDHINDEIFIGTRQLALRCALNRIGVIWNALCLKEFSTRSGRHEPAC